MQIRKTSRKVLAVILCVVMLLQAMPLAVFAEDTDEITTETYSEETPTEKIEESDGDSEEVPEEESSEPGEDNGEAPKEEAGESGDDSGELPDEEAGEPDEEPEEIPEEKTDEDYEGSSEGKNEESDEDEEEESTEETENLESPDFDAMSDDELLAYIYALSDEELVSLLTSLSQEQYQRVASLLGIEVYDDAEQIITFKSVESTLAPGITQSINSGYAQDNKLINYYVATADLSNKNVGIHTTYKDAQCVKGGMAKMTEQAASMTELHSDPEDAANYIPYYAIVAGVNGDGYDTGSGLPSGAHVMNGVAGFGIAKTKNSSWFAIFKDGTALCGANDADWDEAVAAHGPAQEAIGGFQLVRKNGVDCSYSSGSYLNDGRYPRSFVGVTADNKVVFMVADGNGAGGSVGTNWKESVEIMTEAGCTYILCLDGGGSATYISRPEGSNDVQVTNVPSDGSERAVSNGLVMYTTVAPSNVFDHATVTAASSYVTPGSSVKITATGISPAGTAATIPEDAVWEVTGGTLENGVFTAGETTGDAVLSLKVDGAVVGTTTIHVVWPDEISFSRSTMAVPYGASVSLEVTAKYNKLYAVEIQESDITITAATGTIDGWKFTAPTAGESTTVTATLNAPDTTVSTTMELTFGKASETLFDFEKGTIGADLSNWRLSNHGGYTVADISIVNAETGMVHSGDQALAFHYPMDEALHGTGFWAGNSLVWCGESVEIEKATSIGFWVYIPEDATQFSIYFAVSTHDDNGVFAGKSGESIEIYNEDYINGMESSGWHYFSIPLSSDKNYYIEDNADCIGKFYNGSQFKFKANCFIEFYAVNIESWKNNETNYAGDFTFYIDDVTIDYSTAVDDRDAPVFSGMTYAVSGMSDAATLNGQTVTQNKVSFAGLVAEDMTNAENASGLDAATAVAYIDGQKVGCSYADGKITVNDAVLTDGTHTIRMGIADKMGNYTETKRQITVKTGNNDASVRVQPQDSTLNYILNGAVYWINMEADNVENIQSVQAKLDLDSMNNWVLDQIEVLHGFDCTTWYATAAEKAENILTIKLTRNKDYLAETGTAVLASLPIRVWDYVKSDDHAHANAVEAWNCNSVCAPALSIDVDTEMGIVTYLDNTSHSFSSKDIHTLCVSYTYGVYLRDYCGSFYSEHSYHVHDAVALDDVAATCTKNGYTGRTYCETCNSVVNWGTTVKATGHTFAITDGVLKCACGQTYTGIWTDGKEYTDGSAVTDGWNGNSYYKDGVKLTGIQKVDGYYYDFGENGVCAGKVKFTGLFYDKSASAYRYAKIGELVSGWIQIDGKWHYFDTTTKNAVTGDYYYASRGLTYHFDETGMTEGVWHTGSKGTRFWYGEWYYTARNDYQRYFVEIDGKTYNFDINGYLTKGIHALFDDWASTMRHEMKVWEFDENGVLVGQITQKGLIDNKCGGMYLVEEDGFVHGGSAHLVKYNGDIYFVNYSGLLKQNGTVKITDQNSNGILAAGTYYFGSDGKLFTGIMADENGTLYYYKDGQIGKADYNSELVELNGDIYLVKWSGKIAVNETRKVTEAKSNGLGAGTYEFDANGKGTNISDFTGIKRDSDGTLYYYKNGKIGTGDYNSELVEINGDIYLVKWSGKVAANETRVLVNEKTNGLLKAGTYYFGADGTLFNGIKEENDCLLYYYKNGQICTGDYNSELVKINGEIYLVKWSGRIAFNETRKITAEKANGLLKAGTYYFGADGTLLNGAKKEADGFLYFYENGQRNDGKYYSELVEVDGDIYLVKWSGKVATDETRNITAAKANGLVPAGTYYFGTDGKMVK